MCCFNSSVFSWSVKNAGRFLRTTISPHILLRRRVLPKQKTNLKHKHAKKHIKLCVIASSFCFGKLTTPHEKKVNEKILTCFSRRCLDRAVGKKWTRAWRVVHWIRCFKDSEWVFTGKPLNMGVSKNTGTPKWMVYFMENPIKMDDLVVPLFLETPQFSGNLEDTLQGPKKTYPTWIWSKIILVAGYVSSQEGDEKIIVILYLVSYPSIGSFFPFILPTKAIHYDQGNTSMLPYICIVWSPQNW